MGCSANSAHAYRKAEEEDEASQLDKSGPDATPQKQSSSDDEAVRGSERERSGPALPSSAKVSDISSNEGPTSDAKRKSFRSQLTVTDLSAREVNNIKDVTWSDDERTLTEDEKKCNSPRGSFEFAITNKGARRRKALTRSFSLCSNLDAEGGDKKSFHEKAFKQKGDTANPEDHGIYVTCRKGAKTKKSPNQDSWYVLKSDSHALYGVFDGHGRRGHDVSNFVKRTLPKLIENDSRFRTEMMPALVADAFEEMTHLIDSATTDMHVDANKSGTTATIIVHDVGKDLLTVAHVGDSGAVLARGLKQEAEYLTPNHSAADEEELRRIKDCGGRVEFDGHSYRVYLRDGSGPGLNMTRAFGDILGRPAGINSVPDVIQVKLSKTDEFLLVCSDGIWEFISAGEATEIVYKALVNHLDPAKELAVESLKRWNWYADVVDDITCIVIDLRQRAAEHEGTGPNKGACPKRLFQSNPTGKGTSDDANSEDDGLFSADMEPASPEIAVSQVRSPAKSRTKFASAPSWV